MRDWTDVEFPLCKKRRLVVDGMVRPAVGLTIKVDHPPAMTCVAVEYCQQPTTVEGACVSTRPVEGVYSLLFPSIQGVRARIVLIIETAE